MLLWSCLLLVPMVNVRGIPIKKIYLERGYEPIITNRWIKTLTMVSGFNDRNGEMKLDHMDLHHIDDYAFGSFGRISILKLSNNKLTSLTKYTFSGLKSLVFLDLSHNSIEKIENSFDHLTDLQSLNLSHNLLKKLRAKDFFGLTWGGIFGCRINLEGNQDLIVIGARPNVHYDVTNSRERLFGAETIVKTCINNTTLISLEDFTDDDDLADDCYAEQYYMGGNLDMKNMGITGFKKGWYKLRNAIIRDIDLSGNNITRLTSEMFNYLPQSISSLDLSYNKIVRLEKDIIMGQNLREMNFEHNEIVEIEDEVFDNTDLTSLRLSHNNLTNTRFAATLPTNLKEIHLNDNKITEISGSSFLKLKKLTHLYLGKNKIKVVHKDSLRGLSNLEFIDLMSNRLKIKAGSFRDQKNELGIYLDVNDANEFNFNELPEVEKIHYVYLGSIKPWNLTAEVYDRLPRGLQIIDLQEKRVDHLLPTDVFIRPPEYMYLIWNNDYQISTTEFKPEVANETEPMVEIPESGSLEEIFGSIPDFLKDDDNDPAVQRILHF